MQSDALLKSPVPTPPEPLPSGERLRILLVDDESNIREALAEYLMAINNHHVVTADSGEQALAVFGCDAFDCAFLDLKMPGMSGVELLGKIKAQDPKLPVVIMTGFPSLDAAIDTMRQEASDFLIKPFNLGQVKLTLERVVREHRLLRENLRLAERVRNQEKIESLNHELSRRIRQQNTIHQISEAVDRLQTSEDIYQGMTDLAAKLLEVNRAAVLLLDRTTNHLLVIAEHGFPSRVVGRAAGRLGSGVPGKVAAEGEPMLGRPGGDPMLESVLPCQGAYLCLPIKIRGEVFGVMLVADKVDDRPIRGEDIFLLRFLLDKSGLSIENIALYESMVSNLHSTLGALVNAMEAKDPYTRQHSRRVTNLSVLSAQTMGLDMGQIEALRFAAYLHDIGKIGVKDNVLLKASSLSDDEYTQIKQHPVIGETIIQAMDLSPQERASIRHHHEHWNGSGYPDGLEGERIPLLARVVAVSDAFDAMTTDRPYRKAKSQGAAVQELMRYAGTQFDPEVVRAFVEMLARYQPVSLEPRQQRP